MKVDGPLSPLWVLVLTVLMGVSAGAQEEENPFADQEIEFTSADTLLGLVDSRASMSLNGPWRVIVDPMGVGHPGSFFGGFPRNKKASSGMELIEYDFSTAQQLRVPGDFNSQDDRLFFYQGGIWYFRTFESEQLNDTKLHLWFGAANFDAQIYLNGEPLGRHTGGYVPFSFEITDKVRSGTNELMVRIDNSLSATSVPTKRTDWWPYGGLTRDVLLVETPQNYIRNAKIALIDRDSKTIRVDIWAVGFDAGTSAKVSLPELDVTQNLVLDENGNGTAVFTAPVDLWSTDSPRLYDIVIEAGKERLEERVGFRTIETKGQAILLNGEEIKLKGISTHEEPIGDAGVAYSDEHALGLLSAAKDLGANFVRAAHYPYSRHMAKAADELGLLLWAEIPVYWNIDWENESTLSEARNMMGRLVERDWNRSSVIIWSVANETPYSEPRMAFLRTLIDDTRALDSTRLVSAALLGGSREKFAEIITHLAARGLANGGLGPKETAIFQGILKQAGDAAPTASGSVDVVIDDPLAELVDIVAYNEYFGWYYSALFADETGIGEDVLRPLMMDFMKDITIKAKVDKPIHISEFGAGAKYGRKGGEVLIWTEEYQAEVYRAQIEMLRASPQVQGMTPWILKDFRAMLRPLAGVQDYYNRKGLMDENGNRKLAFDVLNTFYAEEW